jgi:hypothetical protein
MRERGLRKQSSLEETELAYSTSLPLSGLSSSLTLVGSGQQNRHRKNYLPCKLWADMTALKSGALSSASSPSCTPQL